MTTDTAAAVAEESGQHPTYVQELGLLTLQEAVQRMGLKNDKAVYKLIQTGKLASLRHGGKSWIEPAEIVDYFARERAEASKLRAQRAKKPGRIRRLNGVK